MNTRAGFALTLFLAVCLVFISVVASVSAYPAGPPPGVTGGFGEKTCNQTGCHAGYELNAGKGLGLGDLEISGLPKEYQSGKPYDVKMTLTHASADRGAFGFQLAARAKQSGGQAGEFKPKGTGTQVVPEKGIQYVEQTLEGALSNVFEFTWIAPAASVGEIVVNAAGNAANGDGSTTGDYIYSTSITVSPAP